MLPNILTQQLLHEGVDHFRASKKLIEPKVAYFFLVFQSYFTEKMNDKQGLKGSKLSCLRKVSLIVY